MGRNLSLKRQLIIKLAAELIRNDIKALDCNKNEYFSFDELTSEQMLSYVPASLQLFLRSLVPSKNTIDNMRYAAIGQSLIQMGRPRSIMCPLQIILGTEVHHRTGSQFIIDVLHKLGFSSSAKDVRKLERSLCLHDPFETPSDEHLPLYSGDNADVQIHTSDGHNTLHVMGMIRSSISTGSFTSEPVERRCPLLQELRERKIPICKLTKIKKEDIKDLLRNPEDFKLLSYPNLASKYDALRLSAAIFKPVPQWSGFMRLLTKDNTIIGKYKIDFLPFIDLDPTDESTIFTTLNFAIEDAKKLGQCPIITFDQPLWHKAMMIKKKKNLDVTIMLGNFHTQMSFLSAIGYVMQNSGIKQILSLVYAENSVDKMLAGKSYERAMRAHDLLSSCLKIIVMEQVKRPTIIEDGLKLFDVCIE